LSNLRSKLGSGGWKKTKGKKTMEDLVKNKVRVVKCIFKILLLMPILMEITTANQRVLFVFDNFLTIKFYLKFKSILLKIL